MESKTGRPAPTPFERFFSLFRQVGLVVTTISVVVLMVYAVGGRVLITVTAIRLTYPHLVVQADPVLLFLVSVVGLFLSITMAAQIFLTLLSPTPPEETLLVVVTSSIGLGLSGVTFYNALRLFVDLATSASG